MFKKILVANRGEIAVRVIKACREMGITSAVIYSEADKNSLHVRVADEAYLVGGAASEDSYLNIDKIIKLAKKIKAEAIHPGYGFLAENSSFIKRCEKEKINFIGPSSKSVEMMGDKTRARELMKKHNVPITPGTTKPVKNAQEVLKHAREIGFPVMLKASAGGGGKGMRLVRDENKLIESFEAARNEARKSFGNDAVYIEKYIKNPKHIEVQIIADKQGNYRHLFERECSIQRRHQKIIEESPSPSIDQTTRNKITEAAINAAKACSYYNAGTIEFLMDEKKNFYFMEMNTRLQVEHPVTEMITGLDLVKEQIKVAANKKISFEQDDISINGHAIECRICAEDADSNFVPSTGKITHHRLPSGPGIRVDRGIDLLAEVSVHYDSLLSKVIAHGQNRKEALVRLQRALTEYQIAGVITNIPACKWILDHELFENGKFTINFIEKEFLTLTPGKWENRNIQEYRKAAAILAALLTHQKNMLKAKPRNISQNNLWGSADD